MNSSNAVTRAIDQLQTLWDEYRYSSEVPICRWQVKQNTVSMIDAFFQVNAEESNDNLDIFLRFDAAFIHAGTFGVALSEELETFIEVDKEALAAEGIVINWISDHREDDNNAGIGFLRNLFHFVLSLELDEDEKLIAFISPVTIEDRPSWKKWWSDLAVLHIPPQLRLMICDVKENNLLESLAGEFPDKISTIQPDLDGAGIMRQLMNEYGDQDDGCTHFRKAYFDLTQQISKRDLQGITEATRKALPLARQIGFPHLEITVLCTAGNGFSGMGDLEKGVQAFDEARNIAKQAAPLPLLKEMPELKVDLPGGNIFDQLSVQSLFYKGAALITYDLFDRAFVAYQDAAAELRSSLTNHGDPSKADWTNGGIMVFHLIEALRMCGYCLERLNLSTEALPYYTETITICEKLDSETRKSTSVAYAGRAMLKIYLDNNKKQPYIETQDKMDQLLGKDWERSLPGKVS